jgi:surfactin synthase thioesterase subunit
MKVISFPFAGGNRYSFRKIFERERNHHALEWDRQSELLELRCILEDLVYKTLTLKGNEEFIIYGHSMGALVGYLVCHKLQELGLPMPKKLVVSGRKSPSVPHCDFISHLNDQEFWNGVVSLGGIPDEMLNYPVLIEYYLPIFRYDFQLIESYQYEEKEKLNIPIDIFYGSEEAVEKEMIGWRTETTKEARVIQLKGNHFFIFDHVDYFKNYFDDLMYAE